MLFVAVVSLCIVASGKNSVDPVLAIKVYAGVEALYADHLHPPPTGWKVSPCTHLVGGWVN